MTVLEVLAAQSNTMVTPGPSDVTEAGVNVFGLRALLEIASAARVTNSCVDAMAVLDSQAG